MIKTQTAMASAFLNMKVTPRQQKENARLLMVAGMALANDVGTKKVPEWNAHLKLKTYQKLKEQGVMA